ncbi:MAG: hypothetical protein IT260_20680 [Saprospiraceae bacterium]|nr:hypothetical protein [Saprospiraceae bacterium]
MRPYLGLSTLALCVAGAWVLFTPGAGYPRSGTALLQGGYRSSAPYEPRMIWVKQGSPYLGDTLSLYFKTPHAPFLGVVDPGGHFFYLVFPAAAALGQLKPQMNSEEFVDARVLRLYTQTLTADPYRYEVYTNQPVFTQSGVYVFILGQNLHVDDPQVLDQARVQYEHIQRPSSILLTGGR